MHCNSLPNLSCLRRPLINVLSALTLAKWSKLSDHQIKSKNKGSELWNAFPLECIHDPTSLHSADACLLSRGRGCYPPSIQYLQYGAGKVIKSIKGIRGVYFTFLSSCCPINMICSWENNTLLRQRSIGSPNCETKGREPLMFIEVIANKCTSKGTVVTDSVSQGPPNSSQPHETLPQTLLGIFTTGLLL